MKKLRLIFTLLATFILIFPQKTFAIGDASITATVFGSPLTITTSEQMAGAISSLTWRGREFVSNHDHGRQIQYAIIGNNLGEAYNPTEAGAAGDGGSSTSKLLEITSGPNWMQTKNQMAFWQGGLSSYVLTKKVTLGYQNFENVIVFDATADIPENLNAFQMEMPTGYQTGAFYRFWRLNVVNGQLSEVNTQDPAYRIDSNTCHAREDLQPSILSNNDASLAIGVYSTELLSDLPGNSLRFALFAFWCDTPGRETIYDGNANITNKWGAVIRTGPINKGSYHTKSFVIVGTLDQVKNTMIQLGSLMPPLHATVGYLDTIDANGNAMGWSLDPDNQSASISVHFYLEGPAGTGTFIGQTTANTSRPDVPLNTNYTGNNHGFGWSIPNQYRDGRMHTLYVYGISTSGNTLANALLVGSGKTFQLTTSITPTPPSSPLPGDLNNDGKVDIFDYNLLVTDFGKTGSPGFSLADLNSDGKVDIFDYNILVENFGKTS